ncbi:MAG: sigma factor [Butyricimonas faecihominis]
MECVQFFRGYSEQQYLYALGFVGDRAEAEDIVQDTFIYLWVNRAKFPIPVLFMLIKVVPSKTLVLIVNFTRR